MEKKITGRETCHPTHLFSPTGDGIPWEDATGAKGSLSVLAEAKKMRALWVCAAITSITSLVLLGVTIPLAVAAFHTGAAWVGALVVAFLAPYPLLWLFSLIAPEEFMGPDECFYIAKRSHRTLGGTSDGSEYFDFAVPFFTDFDGFTRVIVRDRYGWESSCAYRETDLDYSGYYSWDLREIMARDAPRGWGVHTILLEPHISFLNIHEQLELAEHYDDTRIRITLAKIVYAGHQIEAFDYVALDCISDIDSPEGQSLLQEYKRCRQWYQVYLQQNQEDLRRQISEEISAKEREKQEKLEQEQHKTRILEALKN
jgi:hypothetical protein